MADTDYSTEEWRVIPFASDYAVSNFGRVRRESYGKSASPRILKQDLTSNGYLRIRLFTDGKCLRPNVHRLVALAFLGEPLPGQQAAHGDGVKMNNRVENLRWSTPSENNLDKNRHGTMPKGDGHWLGGKGWKQAGEKGPRAKLNEAAVLAIRAAGRGRGVARMLSRQYGISVGHVYRIQDRTQWAYS